MARKRRLISADHSTEELGSLLDRRQSGGIQGALDPNASPAELRTLLERWRKHPAAALLFEMMATHPAANAEIHEAILRSTRNAAVLNAIATNGRTKPAILQKLARSRQRDVREHALLALIAQELTRAPRERFRALLAKYPGEGGIDIGVRLLLANHSRTPHDVLLALAGDEVDLVRAAARKSRENRP